MKKGREIRSYVGKCVPGRRNKQCKGSGVEQKGVNNLPKVNIRVCDGP